MSKKNDKKGKIELHSVNATVADNRRARYEYHLEDKFEAGLVLTGTEVKSLRRGLCSINEAYVGPRKTEIWMFNSHIAEYAAAGEHLQHDPKRPRKLLLHQKEVDRLLGAVTREGYTIIPTRLFFNGRGKAKLEIALAKGKKLHDKRASEKDKDWKRQQGKLLRDRG